MEWATVSGRGSALVSAMAMRVVVVGAGKVRVGVGAALLVVAGAATPGRAPARVLARGKARGPARVWGKQAPAGAPVRVLPMVSMVAMAGVPSSWGMR